MIKFVQRVLLDVLTQTERASNQSDYYQGKIDGIKSCIAALGRIVIKD